MVREARQGRDAVQDMTALDEIELFGELMAVATAATGRLSQEVVDRVLRVGQAPRRPRVPTQRPRRAYRLTRSA